MQAFVRLTNLKILQLTHHMMSINMINDEFLSFFNRPGYTAGVQYLYHIAG